MAKSSHSTAQATEDVSLCIAQTTVGTREDARQLAEFLVKDGFAACVQIDGPIESVYQWQGALQLDREWRLNIKTTATRLAQLREALLARHPYETPEWVSWQADEVNDAYLQWAKEQIQDASG